MVLSSLTREYDKSVKTFVTKYTTVEFGSSLKEDHVTYKDCANTIQNIGKLNVCWLKKQYVFI